MSFLVGYSVLITYFILEQKSPEEVNIIVDNTFEEDLHCSDSERCKYLTQAIYHEGRGESVLGQIAIGHVILNRVKSKHFPNTIKHVILQPHQFSYIKLIKDKSYKEAEAYKKAKYLAKMILLGLTKDPTGGATHYLNTNKLRVLPKWTLQLPKTVDIGNHSFHKG